MTFHYQHHHYESAPVQFQAGDENAVDIKLTLKYSEQQDMQRICIAQHWSCAY